MISKRESEFGDYRPWRGCWGGRNVGQRLSWFKNHWVGDEQGNRSQHHLIRGLKELANKAEEDAQAGLASKMFGPIDSESGNLAGHSFQKI